MEAQIPVLGQGELFIDRYRIEQVAGQGGMGTVYLALDTLLGNQRLALKILHAELVEDRRYSERFIREVQLTRRLSHPNIVRTFEVGRQHSQLYFTMEYVEGTTLQEQLLKKRFSPEETVDIISEICLGLAAIHEAGIVHRDLTPGNVMITLSGEVKITDFGIARPHISDLTGHNEVVGNGPYIPPEVWMGKEVSALSDIYALGAVSYEMLTGIQPFDDDTPAEIMVKHLEQMPVAPKKIENNIPDWLDFLIMRMLSKKPFQRPDCAEQIHIIISSHTCGETSKSCTTEKQEIINDLGVPGLQVNPDPKRTPLVEEPGALFSSTEELLCTLKDQSSSEIESSTFSNSWSESDFFEIPGNRTSAPAIPDFEENRKKDNLKQDACFDYAPEALTLRELGRYWLIFLLRLPMAAAATFIFGYLLCYPIGTAVKTAWLASQTPIHTYTAVYLLAEVLIIGFYSSIAALPILFVSLCSKSVTGSIKLWRSFTVRLSIFGLAIVLINSFRLMFRSTHMFRYKHIVAGFFNNLAESIEAGVHNLIEAAFLFPAGTFYAPKTGTSDTIYHLQAAAEPSFESAGFYYLFMIIYLLVLSVFVQKRITGNYLAGEAFWTKRLFLLFMAVFILECLGCHFLTPVYNWNQIPDLKIAAGLYSFSFNIIDVCCGAVNLIILAILCAVYSIRE
jgi:serine/threonine protein kinase